MLPKVKKLDPRVVRTRRDLMASMCTLMQQKTFSQITVQEVAEQALINRATFYAHFEDKYALLDEMVQSSFQEMLDRKIGDTGRFTPEHLRLLTLTTCEFLVQFHADHTPAQTQEHPPIQQLQQHIYTLLSGWVDEAAVARPDLAAETIVTVTGAMIFGGALEWLHGGQVLAAETITDQIMTLMMSGLQERIANE